MKPVTVIVIRKISEEIKGFLSEHRHSERLPDEYLENRSSDDHRHRFVTLSVPFSNWNDVLMVPPIFDPKLGCALHERQSHE